MKLAIFKKTILTTVSLLIIMPFKLAYSNENKIELESVGGIHGRVKDADDSSSISYATIALFKVDDSSLITGSISDGDGYFTIDRVPEGKYIVEVNFIGYTKYVINEVVVDRTNRTVDLGVISLEKAYQILDEIEVSAERSAVEFRVDKRVLNIDKNLQAKGGTLIEALENTPSIQTDVEGNVMLRGSASFVVLIDGRPSPLSGSDALRQIPAAAVEKIEIITNPSAKFDPDGTAGIINIIMKKEYQNGFNGLINASVGSTWKRSTDFAANYRNGRFNYFIGGRYSERPRNAYSEIYNETIFDDYARSIYQSNDRFENNDPYAVSAGIDYFINKNNTLSMSSEYGHWGFGMNTDSRVSESLDTNPQSIYKNTLSDMKIGGNYLNGVINHDYKAENGSKLSSSVFISTWDGGNTFLVNDFLTNQAGNDILGKDVYKTIQKTDNYETRIKTDYVKPLSDNAQFEAGYQYRIKDETGSFKFYQFNQDREIWREDISFANKMLFVQQIHSVYSTFKSDLFGFNYQVGLRAEYTDRSLSADKEYKYNKIDFFPTIHISRQLVNNQQIQAGYSKRINRPESWFLNPFPSYTDSYLVQTGTPDLLPELTNSFELNYMKYYKLGFISSGAYYRESFNSFTQNLNLIEDGRIRANYANIDQSLAYGLELSSNLNLSKYFSLYAMANVYNYSINSLNANIDADLSTLRADFVINTNVMATKTTKFQVTGFYNSPSISHQGKSGKIYGVNIALNQTFLNNKLSATLSVRDVFKTMVYSFEAHDQGSYTNFKYSMEQQVFMLSLSYKINNFQNRKSLEDFGPQGGGSVM